MTLVRKGEETAVVVAAVMTLLDQNDAMTPFPLSDSSVVQLLKYTHTYRHTARTHRPTVRQQRQHFWRIRRTHDDETDDADVTYKTFPTVGSKVKAPRPGMTSAEALPSFFKKLMVNYSCQCKSSWRNVL